MATFIQQSMAQASDSETPKLRSSCDACGFAKVKCDRGSKCGRCNTMNLDCVYGPSRKFGKPQRKRPRTDYSTPSQGPLSGPNGINGMNEISNASASFMDYSQSSSSGAGPILLPATTTSIAGSSIQSTLPATTNGGSGSNTLRSLSTTTTESGADENNTFGSQTFFNLSNPLPLDDINWSEFSSLQTGVPTVTSITENSSQGPHDCPREAYDILGTLTSPHALAEIPKDAAKTTVLTHLDFVLHNNKCAIGRLNKLLGCDCTKSPHLAMLYASIISRILIWYQQAAGLSTSYQMTAPRHNSPLKDTYGTNVPREPPIDIPAGEPPFSIGMFNIDAPCLQFVFRCQLIFGELNRSRTLINTFISKGSGEASPNGVEGLYLSLGAWLKEERQRIVDALWTTIKQMSDALDPRDA